MAAVLSLTSPTVRVAVASKLANMLHILVWSLLLAPTLAAPQWPDDVHQLGPASWSAETTPATRLNLDDPTSWSASTEVLDDNHAWFRRRRSVTSTEEEEEDDDLTSSEEEIFFHLGLHSSGLPWPLQSGWSCFFGCLIKIRHLRLTLAEAGKLCTPVCN